MSSVELQRTKSMPRKQFKEKLEHKLLKKTKFKSAA